MAWKLNFIQTIILMSLAFIVWIKDYENKKDYADSHSINIGKYLFEQT